MRVGTPKEQVSATSPKTAVGPSSGLPNAFSVKEFIRAHRSLLVILGALGLGAAVFAWGEYQRERQLQTLQWPTAKGIMTESQVEYDGRYKGNGHWKASVAYAYDVAGKSYTSQQITLWRGNNFEADDLRVRGFLLAHPLRSPVEVRYEPGHPENAVLVPGLDRLLPLMLRIMGIALMTIPCLGLLERLLLAMGVMKRPLLTAQLPQRPAKAKPEPPEDSPVAKGAPFLTYEAAGGGHLTCFPDKQCLLDFLGHIGKSQQDWEPEDRAVDSSGRVFKLVYNRSRKWYNLEPTGEWWGPEELLALVIEHKKLKKCSPEELRQRINAAPEAQKVRVILDSMEHMDEAGALFVVGFLLFLLLFFVGVFYAAVHIVKWLGK